MQVSVAILFILKKFKLVAKAITKFNFPNLRDQDRLGRGRRSRHPKRHHFLLVAKQGGGKGSSNVHSGLSPSRVL